MRASVIIAIMLLMQGASSSLIYRVKAAQYSVFDYPGNSCLSFDGTNDYANCSGSNVFNVTKLTFEAWVKPSYTIVPGSNGIYGHEWGCIVQHRPVLAPDDARYYGWFVAFNYARGHLNFAFGTQSSYIEFDSLKSLWDPIWYHIAVTYDRTLESGNVKFYVNGILDSQFDEYRPIVYASSPWQVGLQHGVFAYFGLIDEARLWNTTRIGLELNDTMLRILSPSEAAGPNLVGYWSLDEGTGSTSQDKSTCGNTLILPVAPANPQWVSPGAPVIPEFSTVFVMAAIMAAGSLGAIMLQRRLRRRPLASIGEQPKLR